MSSLRHRPLYCEINLYIWDFREDNNDNRIWPASSGIYYTNLHKLANRNSSVSSRCCRFMLFSTINVERPHPGWSTWPAALLPPQIELESLRGGAIYDRISPAHTNMWYITKKVMFLINSCGAGVLPLVALCFREQSVINQSFPCLQTVSEPRLIWESVHPVGSRHPACSERRSGEEDQGYAGRR